MDNKTKKKTQRSRKMAQRELFSAERARIRHRRGIMGEPVHSKVRRTHGSRFLDVRCSGLHRAYAILHRG